MNDDWIGAAMKYLPMAMLVAATMTAGAAAQETKDVPSDSALVSLNGCAKDRNFIVGERREDQPGTLEIAPGRRFRMEGPKKLLNDIKAHQRNAMQITGLIRKNDISPQGVSVAGGRVVIGGAMPQDPMTSASRTAYNQAVIDVKSWKALTGDCN